MNKYILLMGVVGVLVLAFYFGNKFYSIQEKTSWVKCIGTNAENLLCKSLYPASYSIWAKAYYTK